MPNVTVLGAGSSTVTIALHSSQNADLAQLALKTVSGFVTAGILEQQEYLGSGTMPAPSNILGGVIVAKAGDVGALTAQYVSAVVTATGNSTIVGPDNGNSTVVAGDGSALTYLNLSTKSDITFGKGNHFLVQQDGAVARFDEGASVLQTGLGATTQAFLAENALLVVQGNGLTTVNGTAGADIVVQVQGASTVPVTVNGNGAASLQYLAASGAAVINPGDANVTVFGNIGTGTASVFGSSGAGKLTVVEGRGRFEAGSTGGSQLFTSTVSGSATLVGGSKGDLLFSLGSGHDLFAGAGSSTLVGSTNAVTVGGSRFFGSDGGQALIFGNTAGGNQFFSGAAQNTFDGRNEDALAAASVTGTGNTYFDFQSGAFDQQFISDFTSGLDKLSGQVSGADSATIQFFDGGAGSPFAGVAGTMVVFSKAGAATSQWFAFDANKDGKADVTTSDVIGVATVSAI